MSLIIYLCIYVYVFNFLCVSPTIRRCMYNTS